MFIQIILVFFVPVNYNYLIKSREADVMEITGFSPAAMSAANIMNDISVKVLSKNLDTMETLGDGMVKMMEMSVNPHIGSNIDISV